MSDMMLFVIDPDMCAQFTQENPQPKHGTFAFSLDPLTGGKDLISMNMATNKFWWSRLNPGFSSKNLMGSMPVLIELVELFTSQLKEQVGPDGGWGAFSPLLDRTIGLTFDVITRTSL
jgi:hypothetical protein